MSDAAYIADAAMLSKKLTRMKARGAGDIENAMRQIEREYGIDYGFLWSLRYRVDRLKFISHSIYLRIQAAYWAERERQMRKLAHEVEVEKAMGVSSDIVAQAEDFLREMEAEEVK